MGGILPVRPGDPGQIGPYRIAGFLGEGGQGAVYLGLKPQRGEVAIKVLHARFAGNLKAKARFLREFDAARRVGGFCTAQVLETGNDQGSLYIVSEYIEGESLHEQIQREGPRNAVQLERLAVGTVTALSAIHRAGIVHRDFKPNNVLLSKDGPRVVDFGIARAVDELTANVSTTLAGTPSYMSPEQFASGRVTSASDIFSWAVTMVYAATGTPAFGAGTAPEVMFRIINNTPDLDQVAEPLRDLLARCLDKDPEARPEATELLLTLLGHDRSRFAAETTPNAVLAEGAAAAVALGDPVPVTQQEPRAGRRGFLIAGTGALITLVGGGGAFAAWRAVSGGDGGTPVQVLSGHNDSVNSVALGDLSGQPTILSGSSDRTLRVWNAVTGKQIGEPLGPHDGWIGAVAFGRIDGASVGLTACSDKKVRVWDLGTTRELLMVLSGHTGWVGTVVFGHLNGTPMAASSGGDRTVRVWDLLQHKQRGEPIKDFTNVVGALAIGMLDYKPMLATGDADGQLKLWDLDSHRPLGPALKGHIGQISAVVTGDLDGTTIAVSAGDDKTVRIWDLKRRTQLASLTGHTDKVHSLALGRLDGKSVVVSSGDDSTVRIWDLTQRRQIGQPLVGHRGHVWGLAIGPVNGHTVIVSSADDQTIRIWHPA
jgi:WD40 repeat protein/predicted Ser/Thr protein kinase